MQCKIEKRLRRIEKKKEDQDNSLKSNDIKIIWSTFLANHVKAIKGSL